MKIDPLHILLNSEPLPNKKFFFIGGNEITLMEKISDVIIKKYKEIENAQILNIDSIDNYVNESGLFENKKIIIGKDCKGISEKNINNIRDVDGIFIFKHENSAKSRSIKKQLSKDKDTCFVDCYEFEKHSKIKIINYFIHINNLKISDDVYWFLVEKLHNKYTFIENTLKNIFALETKALTLENIKKILTVNDTGKNKIFFNLLKTNDEIIYVFREKILSSTDANEFFYFCRFYCQQIIDHPSEKDYLKTIPVYLFKEKNFLIKIFRRYNERKRKMLLRLLSKTESVLRKNGELSIVNTLRFFLSVKKITIS
tara:strand:- start:1221 stop:2159 length:939 start_codon:yes stop_codon:yes gene_type:complete